MPELCRMNGMIIRMLNLDTGQHSRPHIHVQYGEYKASISLDGELLAGKLPAKQFREVYAAWAKAVCGKPFDKIAPIE